MTLNQRIDEMVRDFTQVTPRSKSEVRRRIAELMEAERERVKELIIEEIAIAHKEGAPTARLTSLYNNLAL
jgi:ribosomal protein L18E